jgi:hypothetical protein
MLTSAGFSSVYLKYVFCLNESNKGGSNLKDFTISGSGVEHDKKKSSIRETAPLTFILSRKGREDKIMGIGL